MLTYSTLPADLEERSTDLEEGELADSVQLHAVVNPNDYIHPNVILQL